MRILLVDDEAKLVRAVRLALERDGHAVDVAVDGLSAVRHACLNDYDAVLLDVMLPGLDGVRVCQTLRARGRWMPILMLTARDAVEDRIRGLDAGADDYLVKPFAFTELQARLRALLRRGRPERPAQLQVDDVVLDPATRLVSRAGIPVQLSAREFALLEFLMRRKGEVLSRRRILEHVWDYDINATSNLVDVYIGHLRRKLEGPIGPPVIRTVRGVGYGVG